MTKYIACPRQFTPSARALRDELESITGDRILIARNVVGKKISLVLGYVDLSGAVSIPEVNSQKLVNLCMNKKRFAESVRDADIGALYPVFKKTSPNSEDFPLLIRTTLTGFGGRGIIPAVSMKEFIHNWNSSRYWVKFQPMRHEYRAHVFNGEIVKLMRKVRLEESSEQTLEIKNAERGYGFTRVNFEGRFNKLKTQISAWWNFNNLGFGAFALDVGSTEDNYFWIEGNSSPSLAHNTETAKLYAEFYSNYL